MRQIWQWFKGMKAHPPVLLIPILMGALAQSACPIDWFAPIPAPPANLCAPLKIYSVTGLPNGPVSVRWTPLNVYAQYNVGVQGYSATLGTYHLGLGYVSSTIGDQYNPYYSKTFPPQTTTVSLDQGLVQQTMSSSRQFEVFVGATTAYELPDNFCKTSYFVNLNAPPPTPTPTSSPAPKVPPPPPPQPQPKPKPESTP